MHDRIPAPGAIMDCGGFTADPKALTVLILGCHMGLGDIKLPPQ
jgi:hypothetical protein